MFARRVLQLLLATGLCPILAVAQPTHRSFEVVSIRENPTPDISPQSSGPTPDGFRMVNMPVSLPVVTAYVQTGTNAIYGMANIVNIQQLMFSANYDIDARISDADRADWQDPKKQPEMLREMLQAMLADRFKLRVHREVRQQDIYLLRLSKGGPKFTEARPGEEHPGARALPGGGLAAGTGSEFHYYDLPMPVLASMIGSWAGRHVQDDTGLTRRYDLSFARPSFPDNTSADASADRGPSIFTVLAPLGLKLEPAKGDVETLVIDHLEKPTAN
jgi:bla regulator protein blaR1